MSTCYKCEFGKKNHAADCPLATQKDVRAASNAENQVDYQREHSARDYTETFHSNFVD